MFSQINIHANVMFDVSPFNENVKVNLMQIIMIIIIMLCPSDGHGHHATLICYHSNRYSVREKNVFFYLE